jgi:hypothetical protein
VRVEAQVGLGDRRMDILIGRYNHASACSGPSTTHFEVLPLSFRAINEFVFLGSANNVGENLDRIVWIRTRWI